MKKLLLVAVLTLSLSSQVFADDFGHEGINEENPNIEAMLEFALEDEILAYTTYDEIVKAFDVTKPFTNIMKAEQTHIDMVKDIMTIYDMVIPEVDPTAYVILPTSIEDAYEAGVQAEIDNIKLYETFLDNNDVPEDIKEVFEYLIAGSKKHLSAFERQVEKNTTSFNRGFRNNNNQTTNTINGNIRGLGNRNR